MWHIAQGWMYLVKSWWFASGETEYRISLAAKSRFFYPPWNSLKLESLDGWNTSVVSFLGASSAYFSEANWQLVSGSVQYIHQYNFLIRTVAPQMFSRFVEIRPIQVVGSRWERSSGFVFWVFVLVVMGTCLYLHNMESYRHWIEWYLFYAIYVSLYSVDDHSPLRHCITTGV